MTLASLSAENRIETRRQELGCSAIFLCTVAELPASRWTMAIKEIRPLSEKDAKTLLDLTQVLMDLKTALSPVPLALNNAGEVRALLNSMAEKSLTIEQVKVAVNQLFGQ